VAVTLDIVCWFLPYICIYTLCQWVQQKHFPPPPPKKKRLDNLLITNLEHGINIIHNSLFTDPLQLLTTTLS
jgi:hypothetical protein